MPRRKRVQEIRQASAANRKRAAYKTRHGQNEADVAADSRFAVILIEVAAELDGAGKYANLEAELAAIAGVASAKVMTIGTTPAARDLPADVTQEVRVRTDLHLVPVPPAEPE